MQTFILKFLVEYPAKFLETGPDLEPDILARYTSRNQIQPDIRSDPNMKYWTQYFETSSF